VDRRPPADNPAGASGTSNTAEPFRHTLFLSALGVNTLCAGHDEIRPDVEESFLMTNEPQTSTPTRTPNRPPDEDEEHMLDQELLVEEVSIDGMCGVY
jgi:mycofactocin precursor